MSERRRGKRVNLTDEQLKTAFRSVICEKRSIRSIARLYEIDPKTLWNKLVKMFGRNAVNKASTKHGRLAILTEYVLTGTEEQQQAALKFIDENYTHLVDLDVNVPTNCYTLKRENMLTKSELYLELNLDRVCESGEIN